MKDVIKVLSQPIVEILMFRKATQEVFKFFIRKLIQFILHKVSP